MAETETKKPTMDESFEAIFQKLQAKFKGELEVSDGSFRKKQLDICTDHHYAHTLFVEEKHRCEVLEARLKVMYNHLLKQYLSRSTDISASNRTEAIRMVHIDPKYAVLRDELQWRNKIKDYLKGVLEIFNKRYFLLSSIQRMYELDKVNAPLMSELKDE